MGREDFNARWQEFRRLISEVVIRPRRPRFAGAGGSFPPGLMVNDETISYPETASRKRAPIPAGWLIDSYFVDAWMIAGLFIDG
jgi:hypothetical protein